MAGWTEKDIDLSDPEAYHGGGIVTPGMALRQKRKEAEKERKKRIEKARKLAAEAKKKRQRRSKMAYTNLFLKQED